jgi:hemoglobin
VRKWTLAIRVASRVLSMVSSEEESPTCVLQHAYPVLGGSQIPMLPSILACVATSPTLYEWAGGSDALSRMINAFYDRVEQDELLSPFFPGGVHEDHRRHVALWWSEVFGGPAQYTNELGGYERMLGKHLDLGITEQQRLRFTTLMRLAADDAGLPDDPEIRSALVAYLEWGTRIALGNSQPGAAVMEHAPVPKWGWGEAPPYQP